MAITGTLRAYRFSLPLIAVSVAGSATGFVSPEIAVAIKPLDEILYKDGSVIGAVA